MSLLEILLDLPLLSELISNLIYLFTSSICYLSAYLLLRVLLLLISLLLYRVAVVGIAVIF